MADLREVLSGAYLRALAGVREVGEILLGHIGSITGGSVTQRKDGRGDIWVHVRAGLLKSPVLGRLFVPGNMLWRLPREGDGCLVAKAKDADTPGLAYIFHGDAGSVSSVPGWLNEDRSGISTSETVVVESTGGQVELGEADLSGTTDGVLTGQTTDTMTGLPFWMLGGSSTKVLAKK